MHIGDQWMKLRGRDKDLSGIFAKPFPVADAHRGLLGRGTIATIGNDVVGIRSGDGIFCKGWNWRWLMGLLRWSWGSGR